MSENEKPSRQYSVSQLKQYEACPLRYRFHYHERIRTEIQQVESFVGCRVHDTMEYLYHRLHEGELPPVSDVLQYYRRQWELLWGNQVEIQNPERSREWYRRFGEKNIRRYYTYYYPFDDIKGVQDLQTEWYFTITIGDEKEYRLHGQVDRLMSYGEGRYSVHDYKTSMYVPPVHKLQMDLQPGFYQLAVLHTFEDVQELSVHWHYLAAGRELRPTLNEEQVEKFKSYVMRKIDEVENRTEFHPHPSPACRWCEYQKICPAFHQNPPSVEEVEGLHYQKPRD